MLAGVSWTDRNKNNHWEIEVPNGTYNVHLTAGGIADLEELEIFQSEENFGRVRNQHRTGSFETSHLLTALEVLRNTDFLMPGPPFVLRNPTVGYKIQSLPFPTEVSYQVEYMLVRHRRTEKSPLHNWLWHQILDVSRDLRMSMS